MRTRRMRAWRPRRFIPALVILAMLTGTGILGWWKVTQALRVIRGPGEDELKAELMDSGRLGQLEDWVMPQIGQPSDILSKDSQPPDAEIGRVRHVMPITSEAGMIEYFILEFGGGFRHRGLLVGDVPEPHHFSHRYSNRWCENVVYYDVIPQK